MINVTIMVVKHPDFNGRAKNIEGNLELILQDLANLGESYAKINSPHDTGHLEGSIKAERVGRLEYRVFTNVEYGLYQELGFTHSGSGKFIQNPFMAPAAMELLQDVPTVFQNMGLVQ